MVAQYAGRGSKAHPPATLVALLVYGYATGVFSSRKIERQSYDSVAFRFIAAGSHPDHDTIATFRRRFLAEIEALFMQVLELAQEMKLLKLGSVCLDGTKIHANASKHSALSHGHIERIEAQLRAEVQELLALAEAADQSDVPEPGPSVADQVNLTDEDSRIMALSGGGFEQAYNAQAALDAETMLVVATRLTQAPNDKEQVLPMLELLSQPSLPAGAGTIATLIADTGYCSQANIKACEAAGIEPLIAVARQAHHPEWRERFSEPQPLSPGCQRRRDDGAQAQDQGGADALRATETNGRAGVRDHQIGDGISSILAARNRSSTRRMEFGLHGVEFKAHGGTTSKNSLKPLNGHRKIEKRPKVPLNHD